MDPPDVLSDQDVRPYPAQTRRRRLRRGFGLPEGSRKSEFQADAAEP